jgi:hypothetical protein
MLFLISSSFYPYFIWNIWSLVSPLFYQISLNLFKKTDLNKSKILLFIWARPTLSFPDRPTCTPRRPWPLRRSRPLTGRSRLSAPHPLPLPDGPCSSATPPPGTVVAAHPLASPLLLCSAGSVHTAHVTRAHRFRVAAGRAPPVGRQGPPCSCPAPSTCRPHRLTPIDPLLRSSSCWPTS